MRTGEEYIASLRDGRRVMIDGEEVADVTTHPAFGDAVRTIARMYDMSAAAENADLMTVVDLQGGHRIHRCWSIPRNAGDLRARHDAIEAWSRMNLGLMGRTPDLGASFLVGFAGAAELFGERADNVTTFVRRAAAEDLYVSYAIVPPQIDRSRPAHAQDDPHAYAGVVSEREDGIVIRGAQMLGTGTAISDMVLLSCIVPLQPGDEAQAISVVIPVSAPGVKVYSRRSYASAAQGRLDYPLSTRFDETDSLLVFKDVFVPWEHVFVYKDLQLTRDQWYATSSHALGNNQSQVRFAVKLRATVGALLEVVAAGASDPSDRLPELQALATMVDATVRAGEDACEVDQWGVAAPARPELYANMVLQSRITPHVLAAAREILGERSLLGGLQPRGAGSAASPEQERADRAWQLAWDLIGSEFAGRQHQYELFYAGAPFIVRRHMARHYDSDGARELVAPALAAVGMTR
jgi:4-hydroxyphenylacetate 3-monooxygenase